MHTFFHFFQFSKATYLQIIKLIFFLACLQISKLAFSSLINRLKKYTREQDNNNAVVVVDDDEK